MVGQLETFILVSSEQGTERLRAFFRGFRWEERCGGNDQDNWNWSIFKR